MSQRKGQRTLQQKQTHTKEPVEPVGRINQNRQIVSIGLNKLACNAAAHRKDIGKLANGEHNGGKAIVIRAEQTGDEDDQRKAKDAAQRFAAD